MALVGKVLPLSHRASKRINAELRSWRKKTVRGDKKKTTHFQKKALFQQNETREGEKIGMQKKKL